MVGARLFGCGNRASLVVGVTVRSTCGEELVEV